MFAMEFVKKQSDDFFCKEYCGLVMSSLPYLAGPSVVCEAVTLAQRAVNLLNSTGRSPYLSASGAYLPPTIFLYPHSQPAMST